MFTLFKLKRDNKQVYYVVGRQDRYRFVVVVVIIWSLNSCGLNFSANPSYLA